MISWLRVLGLRMAVLCAISSVFVPRVAAAGPNPFAVLDSLDRAFALVYDAAERQVAALEATSPPAPRRDVVALLGELAHQVRCACDAATTALDIELALVGALPPERRLATLGCIEHHLRDARCALARARDPEVRAEYEATCERLRDVRRLIA
jgi:hypothetical protein